MLAPMTARTDPPVVQVAMQPRRLLVEYLGAFVRRLGNRTSSRALVAAMQARGVEDPATRTTVSRLKARGWLVSERRDGLAGYRITAHALAAYETGDEVIWHARPPARLEEGWIVVSVSVPERRRAARDALRARLSSLGFGNTQPGTWVAPAALAPAAELVLAELGLEHAADRFRAAYEPPARVHELVARGWDLGALDARYARFVATFEQPVAAAPATPADAFRLYMQVLNQWRTLAFHDPGLPLELTPADWHGEQARELFEHAMRVLDAAALAHARSL
jgi:phenylacetic acid degradation operon negative regulatory protein